MVAYSKLMKSKALNKPIKLKKYKSLIITVGTCACESWVARHKDEQEAYLTTFERKILRKNVGPVQHIGVNNV